jgi:hypothetical protein
MSDKCRKRSSTEGESAGEYNLRHPSASIAPKRIALTADLTVNFTVEFVRPDTNSFSFKCFRVPETIEWE